MVHAGNGGCSALGRSCLVSTCNGSPLRLYAMGPRQSGCQAALVFLAIGARWRLSSHHQAERHRPHPLPGPNALQAVHDPARVSPQRIQFLRRERLRKEPLEPLQLHCFVERPRLREKGRKCGSVAPGLPEPPWCPAPPAEPVGPGGYQVPSSPRPGSTGAGTAARTSRSELEMRGKQRRTSKRAEESLRAYSARLIYRRDSRKKMDLN